MKKKLKILLSIFGILLLLSAVLPAVHVAAAENAGRYDPAAEGITSAYYAIDAEKGYITGIAPGTMPQHLQAVCLPGVTASQEKLTTGTVLSAPLPDSEESLSLTVIVTGDLNGDGAVTITDLLMLKTNLLGKELTDPAMAAGDVNYDGGVSITDFLRIKSDLLGLEKISAGRKADAAPADPLLLLTPETTATWQTEAAPAAYALDDESLATVDENGLITTAATEGSTYIYALDGDGNVLDRAVITVLAEKLAVSLDVTECKIIAGNTQKLTAWLNHPVTATITWTSSDPAIASVDATGKITAHKPGTATVSATLEGGNTAEVAVTVVSPITAVKTEKSIHKIKPGATRTIVLELTPAGVEEEFIWTSSDTSIAKVDQNGVVTGVKFGTVTITAKGKYSGLTASCKVKVCNAKQIAITFDDGPSDYTAKLLDYLKKNDIKVTFFLVGNRLSSYPETLKRQVAEGHEIGYHSYAHVEQTTLSTDKIISDFEKSEATLKKIAGAEFTLWRTPGGGYNKRVLDAVDLPHIMWSVDSYDWKVRDTYKVYRNIMNQAHDGGIVLIHDLYSFSVNGAIKAMDELAAGDYEFVTVTEILSRKGTPPKPNTNYFNG